LDKIAARKRIVTILLVEDSPDDVFFMKRALELSGTPPSVQVAEDGQVALDYFQGTGRFADRKKFPLPELVLLDLRMPRMPGFEVLNWLRQNGQFNCVPVVVFSSSREERDMKRAYALGANSFLVKTSDSKHLAAMAKTMVEYWLVYNQSPPSCIETPEESLAR
jgi:CheY-like chemotaxis protein